ncbi:MAG: flavodoxin family protein [Candidatus Aminicenantes bacterium]|jgi:flavodoxin
MPKTLVTYFSLTGNTKTIAEEIHAALAGDKAIVPLESVRDEDIQDSSLIFIGFPVHSHSLPFKVESFLKRIPKGKRIALFSTHGSLTGSHLSREALEYAAVVSAQVKILGTFTCRGKISEKAQGVFRRSPEHRAWAEMAASARSHPDQSDREDARSFARWIQTLQTQN